MRIAVGFCYRTMSPTEFLVRMLRLWDETPEVRDGGLISVPYRHWLYEARNQMVEEFLGTGADYLLMVDTDMVFNPAHLRKLVMLNTPISAAAYMFDLGRLDAAVMTPDGVKTLLSDPLPDGPGEVDFAGSGFMLVKREVFEKIGGNWFDHITLEDDAKTWLWEDWSFCKRVKEAGFHIMLDPNCRPGHLKMVTLTPNPNDPVTSGGSV